MHLKKIKVVVVDDSALMRKIISDMINSSENMEVINTCKNGQELLNRLAEKTPDIITLDVEMPVMDGVTTLKELRRKNIEIPVIILSSISQNAAQLTMDCLGAGAFDIVPKPSGTISLDIDKVKDELLQKINVAYGRKSIGSDFAAYDSKTNTSVLQSKPLKNDSISHTGSIDSVVIGASTGGPKALYSVITKLPEELGVPVFVVQHMPVGFTKAFANRLNANSKIKVVEAENNELIEKNVVYVAPAGFHMEVFSDKKIHLNTEPSIWGVRPAVDKLFISASKVYGSHLLSIVLTGMGRDGANGTALVKDAGGMTISEDKSTCTIYGMPKAAYETGKVDIVLPLGEVPSKIIKLLSAGRR